MDCLPEMFKTLADETRFKIINLLLTHDYCVGAIASRIGISEAAVSQHIQILRKAGLAKGEKRSYWTHYSINKDKLQLIAEKLQFMASQKIQTQHTSFKNSLEKHHLEGRNSNMPKCEPKCAHPERLKGKPGECSPEQIKECHGDKKKHSCTKEEKQ